MLRRLRTFCCQLAWLLASLPGWVRFQWALRHPERAQRRVLRRLVASNRDTDFGRAHGFDTIRTPEDFTAQVPVAEYEAFTEAIRDARYDTEFPLAADGPELLEPTSGSSGAPKLIPLNRSLRREFAAAVQPWIAWLLLAHPRLLLGKHYWALSPHTPPPIGCGPRDANHVRIGFSDDADYLGRLGRFVARGVLVNPAELRHVADAFAFTRLTLLFLLAERNLRLLSAWHPSFLTVLFDALPAHIAEILESIETGRLPPGTTSDPQTAAALARHLRSDSRRAVELAALDLEAHPERLAQAWPKLEIISCWGGTGAEPWLGRLSRRFPHARIQVKGLLATEGCVTIPTGCGKKRPCAVNSHYLEFVESGSGRTLPVSQLVRGGEYSVVLTTGGGLWRYRLHDLVRVVDFCHATPCLEFLGKDNAVSDLVGEKLDERHVAEVLAEAVPMLGVQPLFAMLVPQLGERCGPVPGYLLLLEDGHVDNAPLDCQRWSEMVEVSLLKNFHYRHARNLGQLAPVRAQLVRTGEARYRAFCERRGTRAGVIKIPALELRTEVRGTPWWG
jgi:hypothetical protein